MEPQTTDLLATNGQAFDSDQFPVRFGRYRLLRCIGTGGMGLVYLAEHTSLRQRVALKTIKPGQIEKEPAAIRRFYREIESAGAVIHPNVARATDAGEELGVHFLVTEYVDGIDLRELVRRIGPLQPGAACELLRQTCTGLRAIHASELVHRDIKPSNILVTWTGEVRIVDLGLARFASAQSAAEPLTSADVIVGTTDFLAPEQAKGGHDVDVRADLYSVGCTLVWLLTGRALFGPPAYRTQIEKIYGHCEQAPDLSATLLAAPELESLVRKLLEKSPQDRIQSPTEAAAAFAEFADANELERLLNTARDDGADEDTSQDGPLRDTKSVLVDATQSIQRSNSWTLLALKWCGFFSLMGAIIFSAAYFALRPAQRAGPSTISPPPVSPPPVADANPIEDPLGLDDLPLNQWHNVLEVAPKKIVWENGANFVQPLFDPASQQLSASCDFGILQFATTNAASYKVQVAINQQRWKGGAGLYFGARSVTHQGHAALALQSLMFVEERIGGQSFLTVLRESRIKMEDPNLQSLGENRSIATAPLGAVSGEQILEVTVADNRLLEVRVNGTILKELATLDANEKAQGNDCTGGFGALIEISEAVYRNARFIASD